MGLLPKGEGSKQAPGLPSPELLLVWPREALSFFLGAVRQRWAKLRPSPAPTPADPFPALNQEDSRRARSGTVLMKFLKGRNPLHIIIFFS